MSTISKQKTTIHIDKSSSGKGVLFSFETISEIESALYEIFSPSAASTILSTIGKKSGANSCKNIMKKIQVKGKALDYLSKLKNSENWGKISFQNTDLENGSGKIIITDSFETISHKTSQPCCHLFRGFLEGFLSELFNKTIEVTEVKCAGKGDIHCEFLFSHSQEIR